MEKVYIPIYDDIKQTYTHITAISEPTYTAKIYVGQRVEYSNAIIPIEEAEKFLHEYCDIVGFCVTITPTKFIYKNVDKNNNPIAGEEPGFIVGIINYPLYPLPQQILRERTYAIAMALKTMYQQIKVTIEFQDVTHTLS